MDLYGQASAAPEERVARVDVLIQAPPAIEEEILARFFQDLHNSQAPLRQAIDEALFDELPDDFAMRVESASVQRGSVEIILYLAAVVAIGADMDRFVRNVQRAAQAIGRVVQGWLSPVATGVAVLVTAQPLIIPTRIAAARPAVSLSRLMVGYLVLSNAFLIGLLAWLVLNN